MVLARARSEYVAHVWREMCNFICLRHLFTQTVDVIFDFHDPFSFTRAHCVLSYHLMNVSRYKMTVKIRPRARAYRIYRCAALDSLLTSVSFKHLYIKDFAVYRLTIIFLELYFNSTNTQSIDNHKIN